MADDTDCFEKMKAHVKESGIPVTDKRLREFSHQLKRLQERSMSQAEFRAAAEDLADNFTRQAYEAKQAADLVHLAKREKALRVVLQASDTPAKNLASWIDGGALKAGDSTNLDVQNMRDTVEGDLRKIWRRGIEPHKKIASHGALDREIYQELDAIQKGKAPGESGSAIAQDIAKVMQATLNQVYNLKKAFNPFLEKIDDYLVKQTHAREKVSGVEATEWVADALKVYGAKSFPDLSLDEKVVQFRSIYERIKDGSYGSVVDDSNSDKFITVHGSGGNIMKRQAASRVLIADDWEKAFEYNQKYGIGTIFDTMDTVIRKSARDIAILEKAGPNPQGMYEGLYQRALNKTSGEAKTELENAKPSLDKKFRTMIGETDAPARGNGARIVQAGLTWQYLAKTGGMWLSSLSDLQIAAGMARGLNGKSVLANGFDIVGTYIKHMLPEGLTGANAVETLEGLMMFSRSANYELMNSVGHSAKAPGLLGKAAELQGSLTLMNRHVNSIRAAIGTVVSADLGRISHLDHAELTPRWQQGLLRYGIGEAEWNVLRRGAEDWGISEAGFKRSGKLLDSDGIAQIPDEFIENYMRKTQTLSGEATPDKLFLGRKQLEYKLGSLINQHADFAESRPGTRQKAFLYQGTSINEGTGQLYRMLAQFKGATLMSADSYRRAFHSGGAPEGDWQAIAEKGVYGMFLWSIGHYAKEALMGKTPEDPADPKFIAQAMVGSGAAGLFGDVLAAQTMAPGGARGREVENMTFELLKATAGPLLGDVAETAALGTQYLKSALSRGEKAPNLKAVKQGLSLVPFQNMWFSKAAFSHYVGNSLKEFVGGSGYLSNLERYTTSAPGLLEPKRRFMFAAPTGESFLDGSR